MEYQINNENQIHQARHITIIVSDDKEFRISVDKLGQLEIIKVYGSSDGSIHITPNVSNSIKIY